MTQDVQPLTWSKRTNIEEHQQFFSKINEIIGNLAPTVDEAEQAIAQATAAIASANDAVATANAASAAASAAASQAQTAASTVAGYDARLTAAEGDIDTAEGDITTLQGRMTAMESKNSQQDTAIGALQAADAQNVKINNINNYAVGLTGNQDNIAGIKTYISGILNITSGNPEIRYYDDSSKTNLLAGVGVRYKTPTSTNTAIRSYAPKIDPTDNNEIQRGGFLQLVSNQDGTMTLSIFGIKADGSLASKVIASFDGTAWR